MSKVVLSVLANSTDTPLLVSVLVFSQCLILRMVSGHSAGFRVMSVSYRIGILHDGIHAGCSCI